MEQILHVLSFVSFNNIDLLDYPWHDWVVNSSGCFPFLLQIGSSIAPSTHQTHHNGSDSTERNGYSTCC